MVRNRAGQPGRPRHRTIRFHLTCLVAACVLPVWLTGGYLLQYTYQARLAQSERHMQETARGLMMLADRELASIQASLQALATSPALRSGDLATFHAQAREVLKEFPESDILLADATGQQLVNSFRPFGDALPKRNSDAVRRVFETGRPRISDLFTGAVTGRPLVGVDVPVVLDGRVAYDLAMTVPAERFASILRQQQLPPNWVAVILDRTRTAVARTKNPEQSVGRQPTNIRRLQQNEDGTLGMSEGLNIEGDPIRIAFSQSTVSGWTVAINIPKAVLAGDLWRWMRWFGAMAAAVLLAGLGVAFVVGRRVVRDVRQLSEGAKQVAGGNLGHRIALGGVTELAEHAQTFNEMLETLQASYGQLQRSNRELQDFAHVASHDLQEPLRKIQTFGTRLRQELAGRLTEPASDYLARMEGTAGRMQDLIDALLEYSRLVRTGQPFRSVDLKAVALEVLGDLETRIAETGARVEIGDLPEIDADPAQMRQLLQNLVSNALKYHRPGTPPEIAVDGRCRAGAGRPGGEVCEITVTDNGIGFDEQFLDRIFTPFQRLHGRKQFQGTGIGLAIVRKIVERHGGTVTARSEPGQGATFIVELPRRQPGTGAGGRARPAAPGRRGAP